MNLASFRCILDAYNVQALVFKWASPGVSKVKTIEIAQYDLLDIEQRSCGDVYEGSKSSSYRQLCKS